MVCVAVIPVAFQLLEPNVQVPESVEPPLRMLYANGQMLFGIDGNCGALMKLPALSRASVEPL